jgi:putative NADH-flavin reductase
LDEGYQVKTMVRNPEKLGELKNKVEFIQGSIDQTDKLEETVMGTEAVLSTVPPQRNTREPDKYQMRMENLVSVLEKNKINRFIHIGGAAHPGGTDENWTVGRSLLRLFLNLFWKPGLKAKQLEWDVLKKSTLDWTLVRPPGISKNRFKGKRTIANEKNLIRTRINVEDLASFILEQITSKDWIKKAPLVAAAN